MPVILVDIDGTLLNGSNPIKKVIDYTNEKAKTHEIYILTGRLKSEEALTREALDKNGIHYDRLYLNPKSTSETLVHKKIIASKIIERENVVLAIDNNKNMRDMYKSLGIETLDPLRL